MIFRSELSFSHNANIMFLPLGTPKDELDTPALLLDLDLFEANVAQAAAICREHPGVGVLT